VYQCQRVSSIDLYHDSSGRTERMISADGYILSSSAWNIELGKSEVALFEICQNLIPLSAVKPGVVFLH
jgi:hypothetical protein